MNKKKDNTLGTPVNLRQLSEHLGLAPATVAIVLNESPSAEPIPEQTRQRIISAARELGYVSLAPFVLGRKRPSFSLGVVVPELADGYFTLVMNGVEEHLLRAGYLHFIVSHQRRPDLLSEYERLLMKRDVDGLILVNTVLTGEEEIPTVSISGHKRVPGMTNIMLDHDQAAFLALKHLYDLGHRRICFMKGQEHSGDSDSRWESIAQQARLLRLVIDPKLCVFLHANSWSPELGYPGVQELLQKTRDFTAIFCFNDIAAIGAIRALHDRGLSCPKDVSVIGFDDISTAKFLVPSLTTVRQPLKRMGELAAQVLLSRIQNPGDRFSDTLIIQPELVIRESTGPARAAKKTGARTR